MIQTPESTQENGWPWAENFPDIIWRARSDGFVEYVNARGVEYAGWPAEQLQGWGWRKLIHRQDARRAQAAWAQATQRGEPYQAEYRLRRNDGVYRWHLARARPAETPGRGLRRWIGT